MSTFVLSVRVRDPVTGVAKELERQFDPALVTAAKWNSLAPAVQAMIVDLQAATATTDLPPL